MNERDSEAIAGMLAKQGHSIVELEKDADVLIFNTCSVREQAERKAVGKIGIMKKLKKKKPLMRIRFLQISQKRKTTSSFLKGCLFSRRFLTVFGTAKARRS